MNCRQKTEPGVYGYLLILVIFAGLVAPVMV
jgi:hypothetical protein